MMTQRGLISRRRLVAWVGSATAARQEGRKPGGADLAAGLDRYSAKR